MNCIIANIRMPIEIMANGEYQIHSDRAIVDFEDCDSLPPILQEDYSETISNKITSILHHKKNKGIESSEIVPDQEPMQEPDQEQNPKSSIFSPTTNDIIRVLKTEIKNIPKKRQNMTFRNKKVLSKSLSAKKLPGIN
jgi:hypothetical protein